MFFSYCIIIGRSSEEFWNARPSQVRFVINRFGEYRNSQNIQIQEEVTEIQSMHEIAGWGCNGK